MKLPPVLVYSVLRLLAFLVPFGVLMLFPLFQQFYWLAAIFAALIGLSLSSLFLRRPLAQVSAQVERRRTKPRPAVTDEDIEDAANGALATAPDTTAPEPSDPLAPADPTAPATTAPEPSDPLAPADPAAPATTAPEPSDPR